MINKEPLPPTIYVVDDDASIRESLSSLIRSAGMKVVVYESPASFLEESNLEHYACALFDIRMPGIDGLTLHEKIVDMGKRIPVIFITGHGDVPLAVKAMKAGAIDFLNKPFDEDALLGAIDSALTKVRLVTSDQLELGKLKNRYELLTAREREILDEVVKGRRNKQIAYDLQITESTIKVHKHNAMAKMQMRSVAELTLALQRLKQN